MMAKSDKKTRNNEYAVGYGKPPVETRFKPGKSGNPSGRPKRVEISIADLLAETRVVIDRGKRRRMTIVELGLRLQRDRALKGDLAAMRFLLTELARQQASPPVDPYDYELLTYPELLELGRILTKASGISPRANEQKGPG